MPNLVSQVTMSWNGSELICEAANPTTGAREKLFFSFHDLPLEIQFALRENLSKAKDHAEKVAELTAYNAREAREARERAINERNHQAAIEADQRWQQYLSNLAPHVVAYHEHKKAQRLEKSRRSQEIYMGVATEHGIDLANKITEPTRRPKKVEMTKNGTKVTYYPQTDTFKKVRKTSTKNPVTRSEIADFQF